MHETLVQGVRCHIDEIKNVVDSKDRECIVIYGWAFHDQKGILPLKIANENPEDTYDKQIIIRQDVAEFYKREDIFPCGFLFVIKPIEYTELQILIDEIWFPFKELYLTMEFKPMQVSERDKELVFKNVQNNIAPFQISQRVPSFLVVDQFYNHPDQVRQFALGLNYIEHKNYHKGKRTEERYLFEGLKEKFQQLLGVEIDDWTRYGTNGVFQICIAGDTLVYHHDSQEYAGIIYLSPDAPPQCGTSLWRSKHTKKMKVDDSEHSIVFKNGFLDSSEFELVDTIGNVYNRLILFDAKFIHSATSYFGNTLENGRLFQLFFFDLKK